MKLKELLENVEEIQDIRKKGEDLVRKILDAGFKFYSFGDDTSPLVDDPIRTAADIYRSKPLSITGKYDDKNVCTVIDIATHYSDTLRYVQNPSQDTWSDTRANHTNIADRTGFEIKLCDQLEEEFPYDEKYSRSPEVYTTPQQIGYAMAKAGREFKALHEAYEKCDKEKLREGIDICREKYEGQVTALEDFLAKNKI